MRDSLNGRGKMRRDDPRRPLDHAAPAEAGPVKAGADAMREPQTCFEIRACAAKGCSVVGKIRARGRLEAIQVVERAGLIPLAITECTEGAKKPRKDGRSRRVRSSLAAWSLGSVAAVVLLSVLCLLFPSGGKQKPSAAPADDAIVFEASDASISTLAAPGETDARPERQDDDEALALTMNSKPSGSVFGSSWSLQRGSAASENDPGLPPPTTFGNDTLGEEADDVLPIRWRVGVVEPDFGVSELDFRMAILAAINMWESAVGKRLFVYDPSGGMPVELVCGGRLRMAQERYDALKSEVFSAEVVYKERNQAYLELKDTCARYRNESAMRGLEASEQDVYKDLLDRCETEKRLLAVWKEELAELKTGRDAAYEEYQVELQNLKAWMRQNGKGENCAGTCYYNPPTIQIYKFNNGFECIDTIAHELGHALGLKGHVSGDPSFIMYPTCLDEAVVDRHITAQELIVLKEAYTNLKWLRELQIR